MADILIANDSQDNLELLGMILKAAGHEVRMVGDGQEAVEAVRERMPDLVLLDVEMPVLSGPETAYSLFVEDCGKENIPVVLLSGVVGLDEVAEFVGTPYFLCKPYAVDALLRMIDRALLERIPPQTRRRAS
jgi:CheY-like chemotaxis protein